MLATMENNAGRAQQEALDPREAAETLAAVREIEARAHKLPVPWGLVTATGLLFGVGIGFMLAGYVWGLLAFLASMVLIIVLEFSARRDVRTAMKQDVQTEDEPWSWKRFLGFMAVYTVAYIGFQLYADRYPDGNVAVGIVGGVVATVAMIVGYGLTWGRLK